MVKTKCEVCGRTVDCDEFDPLDAKSLNIPVSDNDVEWHLFTKPQYGTFFIHYSDTEYE